VCANIRSRENLCEVLRFLKNHGVPLSPDAAALLSGTREGGSLRPAGGKQDA